MDKEKTRSLHLNNEEDLKRLLKSACPPVEASPDFKGRLAARLSSLPQKKTKTRGYTPIWSRPTFWLSMASVYAVGLIICGLSAAPPEAGAVYSQTIYPDNPQPSSSPPSSGIHPHKTISGPESHII